MLTKFCSEDLKRRDHLEDLVVDGEIKWSLGIQGGKVWIGFNWLRIGTSGGLL
jgi:hypothetical protein